MNALSHGRLIVNLTVGCFFAFGTAAPSHAQDGDPKPICYSDVQEGQALINQFIALYSATSGVCKGVPSMQEADKQYEALRAAIRKWFLEVLSIPDPEEFEPVPGIGSTLEMQSHASRAHAEALLKHAEDLKSQGALDQASKGRIAELAKELGNAFRWAAKRPDVEFIGNVVRGARAETVAMEYLTWLIDANAKQQACTASWRAFSNAGWLLRNEGDRLQQELTMLGCDDDASRLRNTIGAAFEGTRPRPSR